MRAFRYVLADVFTDVPLAGNQLGVFTDARGFEESSMQALALELGFSETVFVLPPREGGHAWIRIFTESSEIPFAGHPTLGTAFVIVTHDMELASKTGRIIRIKGGRLIADEATNIRAAAI